MGKLVFKSHVDHDKKKYEKGTEVPEHLHDLMKKKGLAEELPEPKEAKE